MTQATRRNNPVRNRRAPFLESELKQDRKAGFWHLAVLVTALLSYLAQVMRFIPLPSSVQLPVLSPLFLPSGCHDFLFLLFHTSCPGCVQSFKCIKLSLNWCLAGSFRAKLRLVGSQGAWPLPCSQLPAGQRSCYSTFSSSTRLSLWKPPLLNYFTFFFSFT